MSKYGARKTKFAGFIFDSAMEARRYGELMVLDRAGRISDLRRQVQYELAPSVKFDGALRRKPALRIVIDFAYVENGAQVLEDTKGVETEAFKIKRHLLKSVHGLDLRLSK